MRIRGIDRMHRWRLGTMGCSFEEWLGNFFPERLPRGRWLEHYARQFDAIELNTTFYAVPPPERIRRWVESVGPDFRFSVKAGKHITHDHPLEQAVAPMRLFIDAVRPFGAKLGPILIQLSPHVARDSFDALARLVESLPRDLRFAVEFRNPSWRHPETWKLLAAHNVCAVGLDHERHPELRDVPATADFLYVRLVGRHGRFPTQTHELFDPTPQLRRWLARIDGMRTEATRETWVLFNNDFAGHAPTTLRRFARLAEIPLAEEPVRQQRLFDL